MKYLSILISLILFSCQNNNPESEAINKTPIVSSNGTQQMIDSLAAIYKKTQFYGHPYATGESAALMKKQLEQLQGQNKMDWQLYVNYGLVLLNAGQTELAIQVLEEVQKNIEAFATLNQNSKQIFDALAIAWLRKGEQDNCIKNHSSESCVIPIRGKGIHTEKEGSQKAIALYEEILQQFPEDLQSQWLLNIAYMTLGEYPDKVPQQYLIPPKQFESEYALPEFKNIAMSTGLDINNLAGGVVADDFNNDGYIDIFTSSWGMKDQIRYFVNNGDGTFTEKTAEAGLNGLTGGLNLRQVDYNNDGHLDIYVMRGAWNSVSQLGVQPNSLLRNNGDNTFIDVTIEAGLYSVRPTQTCTWLDFDLDGDLDLFVGNETPSDNEAFPCEFFLNNNDGTFTEIAKDIGLDFKLYIKGVNSADINNDNLPDIYMTRLDGPNLLLVNRGGTSPRDWKFENIAPTAGVELPNASFTVWFFDYDNDGWEDILVTAFDQLAFKKQAEEVALDYLGKKIQGEHPRMYRNLGNETFEDITKKVRLDRAVHVMGCNFGDLDNDGFLDLYMGTGAPDFRSIVPNRVFRNDAGKTFQDVTTSGRFGMIQKGHGVAFADFDNDGDQDIYSVIGGAVSGDVFQNAFYENPGNDSKWITIGLKGKSVNKSAIGAKIHLTINMEDGTSKDIHRTVTPGASFGGNSLQQEIGLGKAKSIENIAIKWPNNKNQYISFGPSEMDRKILIEESSTSITELPSKTFQFVENENEHQHHGHVH